MFLLVEFILVIAAYFIGNFLGFGFLHIIVLGALFPPHLAVSVRRAHDIGGSGWYGFSIRCMFDDSQPGTNAYGPNPKDGEVFQATDYGEIARIIFVLAGFVLVLCLFLAFYFLVSDDLQKAVERQGQCLVPENIPSTPQRQEITEVTEQQDGCPHSVPRSELMKIDRMWFSQKNPATRLNPLQEGFVCMYYRSGQLNIEIPFKNGREEGIAKTYFESGALKWEFPYRNGKVEGVFRRYFESGKLMEETPYKNGTREGIMKVYREDGTLFATILHEASSPICGVCHHPSGNTRPLTWTELESRTDRLRSMKCDFLKI